MCKESLSDGVDNTEIAKIKKCSLKNFWFLKTTDSLQRLEANASKFSTLKFCIEIQYFVTPP